jgi:hypothetical protein
VRAVDWDWRGGGAGLELDGERLPWDTGLDAPEGINFGPETCRDRLEGVVLVSEEVKLELGTLELDARLVRCLLILLQLLSKRSEFQDEGMRQWQCRWVRG